MMWTTSMSKESYCAVAEFPIDLIDTAILAFLCGVGVLLSLFWFPIFRKQRDFNQCQARTKRRRKGGALKGWRAYQSEVEEARKVLSFLQSPLGRNHVTNRFRQLLCPDSSCEVCNRATAEVNQLLFPDVLEDTCPAVSSLVSTAPVTDSSFTLSTAFSTINPADPTPIPLNKSSPGTPSTLSPIPMLPLDKFLMSSSPYYAQLPKIFCPLGSKFPVKHSLPQSLAFPPSPPHDTQRLDPIVQPAAPLPCDTIFSYIHTISQDLNPLPNSPQTLNQTNSFACHQVQQNVSRDGTLPMTQSQLTSVSLKSVLENLSSESPYGLSTYVPENRDIDLSSLSISELSQWQAHTKNMFPSNLSSSNCQREHISPHQPQTCLWGDSANKHMDSSSLSFLGFNIQAHLETQIKKKKEIQTLDRREREEGPLSKPMWSKHLETSSGNSLQSLDVENTRAPETDWQTEGNAEHLNICQHILYVKTLRENLQQKYSQLYWGLPSLHSESLVATLLVSRSSSPLDSPFILFNRIYDSSMVQNQDPEPLSFPHSYPFPLPNVNSQSLTQAKPHFQFQFLPFCQIQPSCHLHSRLPIPPSSSPSQIRDCGVRFHRPEDELDSHISTENQHLEWHVLQKQQENLWGVVPVLQQSQEAVRLQVPPSIPLVKRSSQAHVPDAIHSGHFHIASESQEELESHLPRRSIPHWCYQPCRNVESFALMEPHCELTEISKQNNRYPHSQLIDFKGQDKKDLTEIEWHLSGSFNERSPTKFQLVKAMRSNRGHTLSQSPQNCLHSFSECYAVKHQGEVSKTKSNCLFQAMDHPGDELPSVSWNDTDQRQIETILRLHLIRKFCQIAADRIPLGVCDSWLAGSNTLSNSRGSQTNKENVSLKNRKLGNAYCQISTLEPYFLDFNTQQVLESHILRYRTSQIWGLPLKVLQSIKFYMLREAKTWPLPQMNFPSSASLNSGIASKGVVSELLQRNVRTFQENKIRTTNSAPILNCSLSAASAVDNERQEVQKTPPPEDTPGIAEVVQRSQSRKQSPILTTHSLINTENQSETRAGHEPKGENINSCGRTEMISDKRMVEKNSEHFCIANMFQAQELCVLQSQSDDILTGRESRDSHMVSVHTNKVKTPLSTECPSEEIKISEDVQLPNVKTQFLSELLESGEHIQAQGQPTDMSITPDNLTFKSSLTHTLNTSGRTMEASHMLHVPLEDSEISMEHRQEAWVSKHVLPKYPDDNFPLATKGVDSKAKTGHEDLRLGTSKTRKKSHSVEMRVLEDTSPSFSQDEQFPESYLRKKMKNFSQWIESKRKNMSQERILLKAKFMSTFAQHRDLLKNTTLFVRSQGPETTELMTAIGKILEEKLAHIHEPEVSELNQQEQMSTQVDTNKGHLPLSDTQKGVWTSAKPCSPEPISVDQSSFTHVRQVRHRVRQPQEVETFHNQLFCKFPLPLSREPVPHPPQECPVSQATITPDDNSVFRDLILLFKQKTLLEHFQEGKISP